MILFSKMIGQRAPVWLMVVWGTILIGIIVLIQNAFNFIAGNYDEKFGLSMDGIITIITAAIGIHFIREQVRISNSQIEQQNKNFKLDRFEKRVSLAANHIFIKNALEGCLFFSIPQSCRYFAAWKIDANEITILIRYLEDSDDYNDVLETLKDSDDHQRWSSRFMVSFDRNFESEVFQKNLNGRSIEEFDDYEYLCVSHALMNLQQIDLNEIQECEDFLKENSLKKANDDFIENPIMQSFAKLYKI